MHSTIIDKLYLKCALQHTVMLLVIFFNTSYVFFGVFSIAQHFSFVAVGIKSGRLSFSKAENLRQLSFARLGNQRCLSHWLIAFTSREIEIKHWANKNDFN